MELAQHIADRLREDVKSDGSRLWLAYDADCQLWIEKADSRVRIIAARALKAEIHAMQQEAAQHAADSQQLEAALEDAQRWADSVGMQSKIAPFLRGLLEIPGNAGEEFARFKAKLNSKGHLLAVRNGVVDLKHGVVRARSREDLLSTSLDLEYHPGGDHSRWHQFMLQIMAGNAEEAAWMGLLLGYCITGESNADIIPFLVSPGRSGKTTILGAMETLLGDQAKQMSAGCIFSTSAPPANEDAEKASWKGKRLLTLSETKKNCKVKLDMFNKVTGGDTIDACEKFKSPFDFKPTFTLMVGCNFMPEFGDGMPYACQQRVVVVNMPVTFTSDVTGADDPFRQPLDSDMRAWTQSEEAQQQLLSYCVENAGLWYQKNDCLKRSMPRRILDDTTAFFRQQDPMLAFLHDRCVPDETALMSKPELAAAFNSWTSHAQLSEKVIVAKMKEAGFEAKQHRIRGVVPGGKEKAYGWRLRLKSAEEQAAHAASEEAD